MSVRVLSAALFISVCACGSEAASTSGSSSAAASGDAAAKSSGEAKGAAKGEAGGDMVSCDNSKMGLCSEWRGLDKDEKKDAKGSCNDPGAVFGTAPCKTDKLLGKCDHKGEKITIFMYPNEAVKDVKGAKEMCDDGVFTEAKK
jgi:hypothetical protein